MKTMLIASAAALTLAIAGPATAGTVFSYTADTGTVYEGAFAVLTYGGAAESSTLPGTWTSAGWDGQFLHNKTTGLTTFQVTNMPTHSSIKLNFLIGLLDSWDSTNGSPAPDYLSITIDGNLVATLTTNNAGGSVTEFAGGTVLAYKDQVDSHIFYSDTLLDMSSASWTSFAHSASSITIGFQAGGNGWQGGDDESWGVDNLSVWVNSGAVPEPASWAMMIGGLGLVGATLRRRRTAVSFA